MYIDNFISEDLDTFLTGPERESDAEGCAKTTCKRGEIAVNSSAFIKYGQRRCRAVTSVRKQPVASCFAMNPVRDNDTSAQPQPQAMGAADRDPAGGESPMRWPSQPPSKSFALTPGEVVSNTGAEMRLYRKVLISEAPGIAVWTVQPVHQTGLAMRGQQNARQCRPGGGPCFCGIKQK